MEDDDVWRELARCPAQEPPHYGHLSELTAGAGKRRSKGLESTVAHAQAGGNGPRTLSVTATTRCPATLPAWISSRARAATAPLPPSP